MKKEYLKVGFLGILIIGCIAQTMMLWLGGVLSHNFLAKNQTIQHAISPVKVWLLSPTSAGQGSKSALAYSMNKTKRETESEYERLIMELQEILKTIPEDVEVKRVEGIDWEALFAVSGIVYEYSMPVNLQEMTGITSTTENEELAQVTNIEKIFLQSSTKFEKELTIHLMDMDNDQLYTLQVPGEFEEFGTIYDYVVNSEKTTGAIKYQPSAVSNMSRYIRGNTFMPIASTTSPIHYRILQVTNPIPKDQQEAAVMLEQYVDGFFFNPLIKEVELRQDGSIAFMENKRGLVIYNPIGKLEYVNIAPKIQENVTLLTSYNTAINFVENSTAIPESVREKLYLSGVKKDRDTYICYFDMNYGGHDVSLSKDVKNTLGMESLVEVTVKGNQIVGAQISLLEIEPKIKNDILQTGQLKSEYVDPINEGLEEINNAGYETIVFEDSKAMYLVDSLAGSVYLTRGVLFDDKWYYLE